MNSQPYVVKVSYPVTSKLLCIRGAKGPRQALLSAAYMCRGSALVKPIGYVVSQGGVVQLRATPDELKFLQDTLEKVRKH